MLAAKAKAAGLPPVRFHALRHGYATHALEAKVPLKVGSKWTALEIVEALYENQGGSERLGHSSTAITVDIYSHVTAELDAEADEAVANAIDGTSGAR
jgi:integrase